MTDVKIDMRVFTQDGDKAAVSAPLYWSFAPTRLLVDSDHVVLPQPFTAKLAAGVAVATFLPDDGSTWCWHGVPMGTGSEGVSERYFHVPESVTELPFYAAVDAADPKISDVVPVAPGDLIAASLDYVDNAIGLKANASSLVSEGALRVSGDAANAAAVTAETLSRSAQARNVIADGVGAKPGIVDYFDRTNLTVDWSSVTAGGAVAAANAGVTANRLIALNATNPGGVVIPFQVLPGETAHIKGLLFWKLAAAATPVYIGIDTGTAGHAPVTGTPDGIHLGVTSASQRTDAMGANHAAALAARIAPVAVGANPAGADTDYSWGIDIDLDTVSFHLRKIGDAADLYSFSVARAVLANAAKVITGISLYLTATAGGLTHQLGPVVATKSLQPSRTGTIAAMAIEGAEHGHRLRTRAFNSAERWRIQRPKTYNPIDGADMCLFMKWAITSDDLTPWSDVRMQAMTKAVSDAGMFFASASDGGLGADRYGAPVSLANYLALYQHVRNNFNVKKLFILCASGGGIPALNALSHDGFPTPGAVALIAPATDLRAVYDLDPQYAGLIRSAYGVAGDGSDYAAKTAGYDPALRPGADFRYVPTIWFTSPGDTVVPTATHVTPMVAKLSPLAPATVMTRSGIHLNADLFQPADVVNFFNTYR